MIYNLGSINADFFYRMPRLPGPGETLAATAMSSGPGGKGANQSVALARAGAEVRHIGAVGADGQWLVEHLALAGVDTANIRVSDLPTAHAIVMIDEKGENQIVIFPGANHDQDPDVIKHALEHGRAGDWLLLQNETSHQVEAAEMAKASGITVVYSAAPFDADAVAGILPHVSLLIMNEVEAAQLAAAMGKPVLNLPVANVLVTKGSRGVDWHDTRLLQTVSVPAFTVSPIDTTGAGDTFAGYAVAGLSKGQSPQTALHRAAAAAAISVTRPGTADAIPSMIDVEAFLA